MQFLSTSQKCYNASNVPSNYNHSMHHMAINPLCLEKNVQTALVDTSNCLSLKKIKLVQRVVGFLLYYSCAIDPTTVAALSSIAACQANGTEDVLLACHQLLDYVATYHNATICFLVRDMVLVVHLDASYLSNFGRKSRAGGHHFCTNKYNDIKNGPILTLSNIIKNVLSSESEAELAALLYNGKLTMPLWVTLVEMGHLQPKLTYTTDNSSAHGLITKLISCKVAKAMDVCFQWIKCCQAQNHSNTNGNKVMKTLLIIIQNITCHLTINNGAALTFVKIALLNSKNPNQVIMAFSYC